MRSLCKGLSPVLSEHPHHGPEQSSRMQCLPLRLASHWRKFATGGGDWFRGRGEAESTAHRRGGRGREVHDGEGRARRRGSWSIDTASMQGALAAESHEQGRTLCGTFVSSKAPRLASSLAFHFFVLSDAQSSLTVVPSPVQPDRRLLRLRHGGRHTGVQLRPFQGNDT